MVKAEKINEHIYRVKSPYHDIYTTTYLIKTENGNVLFDAASYPEDVSQYIAPAMSDAGIDRLDYIFISHNHLDHAGALEELMKRFPKAQILSRCPKLKEKFSAYSVTAPNDGDTVCDVLQVVTIPGHTQDAAALLDTRTSTMICGDCLQLFGIFGSGKWAANITLIPEHLEALEKLRAMPIEKVYTAHDYHPLGFVYTGREQIHAALDACIAPLVRVKELIAQHPEDTDEQIADWYNSPDLPVLGAHVVTAVRRYREFL